MGIYDRYRRNTHQPVKIGDWICVSWMHGQPTAEVIGIDDDGWPVIERPDCPGLGPMTCDVFDWVCSGDDIRHAIGAGI